MTLADAYYLRDRPRRRVRQLYIPDNERGERGSALFVQRKLRKVFPPVAEPKFGGHFEALDSLAAAEPTAFPEPPSKLSLDRARDILQKLAIQGIEPVKITPAAEGGVAICLANRETFASIESLNSGDVLGIISNRRDRPTVWEIEPTAVGYAVAFARILAFLTSRSHDAAGTVTR